MMEPNGFEAMLATQSIIQRVRNTISRYRLIESGDRIVVAVSGGPDSVCLLDILFFLREDFRTELMVAHFDHGLRPNEDEAETRFVESLATTLSLPFETRKGNLDTGEGSLEERARNERYRFLEEVRERYSAQKIALGHQRNDQAETVLMRLLRGSGTGGLSGIPPVRSSKTVVRPILDLTRFEIESYLRERGIPHRIDSSNLDESFLRNRIRLQLLPYLENYQPRVVDTLAQTADILRADHDYLEAVSEKWLETMGLAGKDVEVDVKALCALHEAVRKRVIRLCLRRAGGDLHGVGQQHVDAVDRLASGTRSQGETRLPKGLVVRRTYDRLLFFKPGSGEISDYLHVLKGPGRFVIEDPRCTVLIEEWHGSFAAVKHTSPWIGYFDADRVSYPLVLRNFRPGDRFIPLGMNGHKKVKDFFVDLKIPLPVRKRIPLLVQGEQILWVCGMRIDDRVKVSRDSEKIVKVAFLELTGLGRPRDMVRSFPARET